jgi:hypothetical protein
MIGNEFYRFACREIPARERQGTGEASRTL